MKMKFGAIVVDGRGKIGGHVASKNRGGAYLRTKVTPSNPQSLAQNAVRNRLTALSQGFRGLTAAQIAAWNAAGSNFTGTDGFGDVKTPSGLNLYTKLNSNLGEVGASFINNPPLPQSVTPITSFSAVVSDGAGTSILTFAPTPVPTGYTWLVRATAPVSAGISNLSGKYRNIKVLAAATATGVDVQTEYEAKFGAAVVGQKIGFELVPVNLATGQKGQGLKYTTVVVA